MKKMKLFALMFLAGALIFSSCKKDDDDVAIAGPSITFQNGNNSLDFDTNNPEGIDVNVDFKADGKVASFKITFLDGDSIIDLTSTYKGDKSGTYRFERSAAKVGADLQKGSGTVKYLFTLIDKEDNKKQATYIVKIARGDINSYTAVLLGGQSNLSEPSAYDAESNSKISVSNNTSTEDQAKVDFIFAYGTSNEYYIAAPSNDDIATSHSDVSSWTTRNATKVGTTGVTSVIFDAIDDDALIISSTDGISTEKVNHLTVNQVFGFITVNGKKGLAKVVSVEGTDPASRKITLDVKVQQ